MKTRVWTRWASATGTFSSCPRLFSGRDLAVQYFGLRVFDELVYSPGMNFPNQLREELADRRLARHPFYTAWTKGTLQREQLQHYAEQYFHHVDAFPRYVSATHSRCEDIRARQVLLENLRDEEEGAQHHPELWLRFAEGLGCSRESVRASKPRPETAALVETFFEQAYAGYATGLGALFAYEDQVPEVAELKIEALSRCYDVQDDRTLAFFRVHQSADKVHAGAVAELLEALPPTERERASGAAQAAATALWRFLDSQDEASPRSS